MDEWYFLLETVSKSWKVLGCPERVTAAVSGGADSVALLWALHDLSRKERFFLTVAHVDHGMRETSGRDAAFVAQLCAALQVPCEVYRVQVQGKSEDAARRARYEALENACRKNNCTVLALAHHRRDQAETVLLRLFRGSGSGGLSAMGDHAVRGNITLWRPLLNVSPDSIRKALSAQNISCVEDETNAEDQYLRNYVRHQILPAITARFPQAEEAISRSARTLSEEDAYFRQEAERFLNTDGTACLTGPCTWIRYAPLQGLHPALRRYAIRMACPVKLDWETTEALMALSPGQKMNLPENGRAECSAEYLHFLPAKPAPPILGTLTEAQWDGETGDGKRTQAIKKRVYAQCELRFLRPGDRIHPLGASGSKSMQDYFVDKKVPRPFRHCVPLLCIGQQVVWAIGVGPGEEARVSPGDDAALLRYEGLIPGR